jgi:hypothetical protein
MNYLTSDMAVHLLKPGTFDVCCGARCTRPRWAMSGALGLPSYFHTASNMLKYEQEALSRVRDLCPVCLEHAAMLVLADTEL